MERWRISSAGASAEKHACHCGRVFLRKEHLRRHQAVHEEPSFVCHVCQKAFTRSDLLRRHAQQHEINPLPSSRTSRACTACHSNKIKCEILDGDKCSSCLKKGIECVFLVPPSAALGHDHLPGNVTTKQPSSPPTARQRHESPSQLDDESERWYHSKLEMPRQARAASSDEHSKWTDDDTKAAQNGLAAMAAEIKGRRAEFANEPRPSSVQTWMAKCMDCYFGRFHERWPVLHIVDFDERTDPAVVAGSVAVIGSWLRHPEWLRDPIIEVHKLLVSRLVSIVADPNFSFPKDKPWPRHLYQAMLLNVIFAFETGRNALNQRARLLLALLVSAMRENRVFEASVVESHEQAHRPGTFLPYAHLGREQWKALAVYTFKIDTYLSITRGQPPLLTCEELDMPLTSTFSILNAYGMDSVFARYPHEPMDRFRYRVYELCGISPPVVESGTLIEDATLGLCGIWRRIHRVALASNMIDRTEGFRDRELDEQKEELKRQLSYWKDKVNASSAIFDGLEGLPGPNEAMLRAYAGPELPHHSDYHDKVTKRIFWYIFNARTLYHLLSLYLHTSLSTVSAMDADFGQKGAVLVFDTDSGTSRQEMSTTDIRHALLHALRILQQYEAVLFITDEGGCPADPIAHLAITAAAEVVSELVSNPGETCHCLDTPGAGAYLGMPGMVDTLLHPLPTSPRVNGDWQALDVAPESALEVADLGDRWQVVGGTLKFRGLSVCKCKAGMWARRFESALRRGSGRWEFGIETADNLRAATGSLAV